MVYEGVLEGRFVNLRSVREDDAEFTLELRKDPILTQFIPRLNITLEQQKSWIRKQRIKDGDFFFLFTDKKDVPLGVLGIYDIINDHGETGRISSRGNSFQSLEAQLLCFDFIFDVLKLSYTTDYVYDANIHAKRLTLTFGGEFSSPEKDDDGNCICRAIITKDSYQKARINLAKMLYR